MLKHHMEAQIAMNKDAVVAALKDGGLMPPEFFNHNLPPGYRFSPKDEELIGYLTKKVSGKQLPANQIFEVDLYAHNPLELTGQYNVREAEWYFFTPRDRKYPGGNRPCRATREGYWKPTGADTHIVINGHTLGFKKALDFYQGKNPAGKKTEWKMHEYTLNIKRVPPTKVMGAYSSMKLDEWVLCKVYKNSRGLKGDQNLQVQEVANEILAIDLHVPDSPLNQQGSQEGSNIEQNFAQAMPMSDPALQSNNIDSTTNDNPTNLINGECTQLMIEYTYQDSVPCYGDDLESLFDISNIPIFDMELAPGVDQGTNSIKLPSSSSPEDNDFINSLLNFDQWDNE